VPNRLAAETSPYLQQHADNPVDWYPWGDAAFSRARSEDRPILLSVGYSACHWCHVMAHESFDNPQIAALMNELFVNVKVDREERPDVDAVYMQAVQAMSGHGGWPMTVFLTPAGLPFFGGTYFPPEDRMGMRGFPTVLAAVADAYRTRRSDVEQAGERLRAALAPASPAASAAMSASQLDAAARELVRLTDRRHGGFGGAPKFPHSMALDLMLRRFHATGDDTLRQAADITLDAMARGGIFDQVGGGFHRYSVDERWAVPHFEKMLYDNAQLVPVYLHAYQTGGRTDFLRVALRTLDYMARELRLPSGGFAASQDADSPGGEGAFFVWTPEQLRDTLGDEDGALAARVFGVVGSGNFEDGTTVLSIPYPLERIAETLGSTSEDLVSRVDAITARLYRARCGRPAPGRDDKVITAWNALAIQAFAEAGMVAGRDDLLTIARQAADFLLEALVPDAVVLRSWRDGAAKVTGFLEDNALLAGALLTLYEASGEPRYFVSAKTLCEQVVARFRDSGGAYFDTASDGEPLIIRPRSIDDNPVIAGQSAAAAAFLRLHALTGEQHWHDHAVEIITPLADALARIPLALGSLGAAMEMAIGPVQEIAIAGDVHNPATVELVSAVWRRFHPLRVLAWGPSGDVPLLAGRPLRQGLPAAYVCEHFVCKEPVIDVAALEAQLAAS
jgi:uncharacterized protein YyaL (SSP411 family)